MLCEDSIQLMGILVLILGVALVYLLIDILVYGPIYRLFSGVMERSDMYGHYRGGYSSPRYVDVWVNTYIDRTGTDRKMILTKVSFFTGTESTHEWRWIISKGDYGWVEKEIPLPKPEPSVYISEGAKDEVDRILAEYKLNKNSEHAVEDKQKETKSA